MDVLLRIGVWRLIEGTVELLGPILISAAAIAAAYVLLSTPTPASRLSLVEVSVLLGGSVTLLSWAGSRLCFLAGWRLPWRAVIVGWVLSGLLLTALSLLTMWGFQIQCDALGGQVVDATSWLAARATPPACQIGAVAANDYLPGVILRAPWSFQLHPALWVGMAVCSMLGALAFRDRRLLVTRLGVRILDRLHLAPAAGSESALSRIEGGRIQACGNPTLWDEPCGQIYPAEQRLRPGEWCVRCQQPYHRSLPEITLRVFSIAHADIDVLNGIERLDTQSWRTDRDMPADLRSSQPRWVELGELRVPEVLSVAQTLALAHEQLSAWSASSEDESVKRAAALAKQRASRVSAWLWFGSVDSRLIYARPTREAALAIGATRLQDLTDNRGGEIHLQLDTGLLPLSLRLAFFREKEGEAIIENVSRDLWIPVSAGWQPRAPGVWVPRVEGKAIRAWLSTERLRAETPRASQPIPYQPYEERGDEVPQKPAMTMEQVVALSGRLELRRVPLCRGNSQHGEGRLRPDLSRRILGDSLGEWSWLEWRQIELLRRECLVLVEREVVS